MTEPHARAVAAIDAYLAIEAYLAAHADQGEHGISGREIVSIVLASIRTAEEERADVAAWLTQVGRGFYAHCIEDGKHIGAAKKGQL